MNGQGLRKRAAGVVLAAGLAVVANQSVASAMTEPEPAPPPTGCTTMRHQFEDGDNATITLRTWGCYKGGHITSWHSTIDDINSGWNHNQVSICLKPEISTATMVGATASTSIPGSCSTDLPDSTE